jgi:hypothetical protein
VLRRARRRGALLLAAVVLAALTTACGAAGVPQGAGSPRSTADPSATASPTNSPQVPTDGVTLAQLGFAYGPAQFSIPRAAAITTASDQENTVTLVIAAPTALDLAAYFRRALPATGFALTGDKVDGDTATLAFTGAGWRGSVTGRGDLSGVTLMRGTR